MAMRHFIIVYKNRFALQIATIKLPSKLVKIEMMNYHTVQKCSSLGRIAFENCTFEKNQKASHSIMICRFVSSYSSPLFVSVKFMLFRGACRFVINTFCRQSLVLLISSCILNSMFRVIWFDYFVLKCLICWNAWYKSSYMQFWITLLYLFEFSTVSWRQPVCVEWISTMHHHILSITI